MSNTKLELNPDIFENLKLELRRGCLVLAVLAQLRTAHYGYALRKVLTDQGIAIDENTLYPLLRRLESQGLLVSYWREEENRNRRFYQLARDAEPVLSQLLAEWRGINSSLDHIIDGQRQPVLPESKLVTVRKAKK